MHAESYPLNGLGTVRASAAMCARWRRTANRTTSRHNYRVAGCQPPLEGLGCAPCASAGLGGPLDKLASLPKPVLWGGAALAAWYFFLRK